MIRACSQFGGSKSGRGIDAATAEGDKELVRVELAEDEVRLGGTEDDKD
jgi:hypothetical protein